MECEYKFVYQKDRQGNHTDCGYMYNCCDCGTREEDKGCGCSYCFSCNACENCLKNDD
jgi:hypothetical protein